MEVDFGYGAIDDQGTRSTVRRLGCANQLTESRPGARAQLWPATQLALPRSDELCRGRPSEAKAALPITPSCASRFSAPPVLLVSLPPLGASRPRRSLQSFRVAHTTRANPVGEAGGREGAAGFGKVGTTLHRHKTPETSDLQPRLWKRVWGEQRRESQAEFAGFQLPEEQSVLNLV